MCVFCCHVLWSPSGYMFAVLFICILTSIFLYSSSPVRFTYLSVCPHQCISSLLYPGCPGPRHKSSIRILTPYCPPPTPPPTVSTTLPPCALSASRRTARTVLGFQLKGTPCRMDDIPTIALRMFLVRIFPGDSAES